MRHIILTTVMLCFVSLMAAAQTSKSTNGNAAQAVQATAQTQINAARQAAQSVNFDSIEADINAALPEISGNDTAASESGTWSNGGFSLGDDDDDMFDFEGGPSKLALLAVIGIFILPPLAVVLIVFLCLYFRSRNKRAQYEAMARAAQNGVILPPIPDTGSGSNNSPYSGAVTLIAVGIGIAIFFACADEWEIGIGIGCIPALIGAARLLTRWLDSRSRADNDPMA